MSGGEGFGPGGADGFGGIVDTGGTSGPATPSMHTAPSPFEYPDRLAPEAARLFVTYPVRKTAAQKQAFRQDLLAVLAAAGWPAGVESGGRLPQSHNVIAGDLKAARLVFTAHYDTPARLPFPNFIAPRNLVVSLLYQVLLAVVLCIPVFLVTFGTALLGLPFPWPTVLGLAVAALLIGLMLAGPANPRNANDNTSGVVTLLQIAHSLPPELRQKVALVFFDNEEKGLVGASLLRKKHGALGKKLLVNFDCVGDGDTLLLLANGACRRDKETLERISRAFDAETTGGSAKAESGHGARNGPQNGAGAAEENPARALLDVSPLTFYPSDQMLFYKTVGVVALRRAPLVGHYLARIHTRRDTVLRQQNILQLSEGAVRLAAEIPASSPAPADTVPAKTQGEPDAQ